MSTTSHPVTITLGGSVLPAVLEDSTASRSLLSQLPVTVSFSDYAGQELTASLPQPLDVEGMSTGAPQAGDIAWYTPDEVLVLAYTSVGQWPGLYVIGHIKGDVGALRDVRSAARTVIDVAEASDQG